MQTLLRGAGDRRHPIKVNRRTVAVVNLESVPTYTPDTATRWAAIEPLSVKELLIAEDSQVFSECTHKITMLWTATNPHASDQIIYGTRVFELVGEPLNREEINREIVCLCVERVGV